MNTYGDVVLVRVDDIPGAGALKIIPRHALVLRIKYWLRENIDYNVDWGFTAGYETGFFLKPEDAVLFKLTFTI